MIKKFIGNVLLYTGRSYNFSNGSIHRNSFKDLARPSFPIRIQALLPIVVAELEKKELELKQKYGWIKNLSTTKKYQDKTVEFSSNTHGSLTFGTFNVARYNTKTSTWSWSWVNHENKFDPTDESNFFRAYGSKKKIELMIKANWSSTQQEVINVLAICVRLRSALGVDVEKKGEFEYYRLILENE